MDKSINKASVVLFFCISLYAGNDEELFLRGNKLYAQHDYTHALTTYDSIVRKGQAVFYNMGNCAFHMNNYAQALVYWGRAAKGATLKEKKTVEKCRAIVFKKLGKHYDPPFTENVKELVSVFSLLCVQIIFILCWYAILIMMYGYGRMYKKMMISVCICLCIVSGLLYMRYEKEYETIGVVMHKNSSVFAGPHSSFYCKDSIGIDYVKVLEKKEDWYTVKYFDTIGWIKSDAIQLI